MRLFLCFSALMLLAACGEAQQANAHRAKNMVLVEAKNTGEGWRKFFSIDKPADPYPRAVAPAYCYRLQTDVLCYRRPQAGMEDRLVGQQPLAATLGWVPTDADGRPSETTPVARIESGGTRSTAQEAAAAYVSGYSPVSNNTLHGPGTPGRASSAPSRVSSGPRVLMPNP